MNHICSNVDPYRVLCPCYPCHINIRVQGIRWNDGLGLQGPRGQLDDLFHGDSLCGQRVQYTDGERDWKKFYDFNKSVYQQQQPSTQSMKQYASFITIVKEYQLKLHFALGYENDMLWISHFHLPTTVLENLSCLFFFLLNEFKLKMNRY